jgi:hypothetical protein
VLKSLTELAPAPILGGVRKQFPNRLRIRRVADAPAAGERMRWLPAGRESSHWGRPEDRDRFSLEDLQVKEYASGQLEQVICPSAPETKRNGAYQSFAVFAGG